MCERILIDMAFITSLGDDKGRAVLAAQKIADEINAAISGIFVEFVHQDGQDFLSFQEGEFVKDDE